MRRRYRPTYSYKPRSQRRADRQNKRNIIISALLGIGLIYFLLSWGLPALIGGLSIFHKVDKTQQTTGLIEDSAIAPPVLNIPYEATNTATIKISGFSSPHSKVEIYLDDDLKTTTEVNGDGSFITDSVPLALGTNNIYGKTVDNDKKSLASKLIKLIYNNDKPKLELAEPADGAQIKGGDKKIRVSGKTDPDNNITINGATVIVNGDGSFATTTSLNDGDNTITVVATNSFGNSTQLQRKVNYAAS